MRHLVRITSYICVLGRKIDCENAIQSAALTPLRPDLSVNKKSKEEEVWHTRFLLLNLKVTRL